MNVSRMTKAELIAEAVRQGKPTDDSNTREDLIAMLADGIDPATITLKSINQDAFVPPERLSGKKQTILIPASEGPGGADPVPVGLNGKVWTIPRDVSVDVPVELCGILKDAVTTILEPDGKNTDGTMKWKERNVRRFPVQYGVH